MDSNHFYKDLKSFSNFKDVTDDQIFCAAPINWTLILTDVKDSTQAIATGHYKDVNLIGAACIATATNCLQDIEIPYVFGGDGAAMLVPDHKVQVVVNALTDIRDLAKNRYEMLLRIGFIKGHEIQKEGKRIEIAKYEITKGRHIAIFRGDGLKFGEEKIKEEDSPFVVKTVAKSSADLSGLSCRWYPVKNKNGVILSIMIMARKDKKEAYKKILDHLYLMCDNTLENLNPVDHNLSSYKSMWECFKDERKLHDSMWTKSFWKRIKEIFFAVLIFKHNFRFIPFDADAYLTSIRTHSDYKKFDDMLRMIIDVSPEQEQKLTSFLEQEHKNGTIFYGIHSSQASLITCFVKNMNEGGHIHFVDGEDGGYAKAAIFMKAQIQKVEEGLLR